MKLAGIQKLTLLDFPGRTAATVFTSGCNFRCPFCHNADLVLDAKGSGESAPHGTAANSSGDTPRQKASAGLSPHAHVPSTAGDTPCQKASAEPPAAASLPIYPVEDFFSFLDKRKGLLDGVCITGGEPTLQPDLAAFCAEIHRRGFQVKLDTNGSQPEHLRQLIEGELVDYVAMDVKNAPERYAETIGILEREPRPQSVQAACAAADGIARFDLAPIRESVELLEEGHVPYEFRTTVVRELHTATDLRNLALWLSAPQSQTDSSTLRNSARAAMPSYGITWFLQSFIDAESILGGTGRFHPWHPQELRALLPELQRIIPRTALRGIE